MKDKEALKREYNEVYPKYERLAQNIKDCLSDFIKNDNIDVLDIEFRIKEFESFYEKIERKKSKEPFREMEDICGLRVICFYPYDLKKIVTIIEKEFNVIASENKADIIEPEKFGYRSVHFIVTAHSEWLKAPNWRGSDDLKAEIQVRTILMHAWADVQGKLAYKKEEHVPNKLRRKLSRLSAMFEVADEQLDSLREVREVYKEQLISKVDIGKGHIDTSLEINLDILQAFLDFNFPKRTKNIANTSEVLDAMIMNNVTIGDLVGGYEKAKGLVLEAERGMFGGKVNQWTQAGVARQILDLTHDEWWEYRKNMEEIPERIIIEDEKWRAKI